MTAIKESGNCMKDEVLLANLERVSGEKEITGNLSVVSEEKDIRSILENTYSYQIYLLEYGLNRVKSDISFYEKILRLETEK